MRMSTRKNLLAIPTSFRWLSRHPLLILGVSALWAVLLTLAPYIQIRAHISPELTRTTILNLVLTLPMEFFFLPMLLAFVDAESHGHPSNPLAGWRSTFESRWGPAALARLILYVLTCVGMVAFIIPGVLIFVFLGWMPMYVLLRGGTVAKAARWSYLVMASELKRVLLGALPILVLYLAALLVLGTLGDKWAPQPTLRETASWGNLLQLWMHFHHPFYWVLSLLTAFVNVWMSLAFLALFHGVENEAMLKAQAPDQSLK